MGELENYESNFLQCKTCIFECSLVEDSSQLKLKRLISSLLVVDWKYVLHFQVRRFSKSFLQDQ